MLQQNTKPIVGVILIGIALLSIAIGGIHPEDIGKGMAYGLVLGAVALGVWIVRRLRSPRDKKEV